MLGINVLNVESALSYQIARTRVKDMVNNALKVNKVGVDRCAAITQVGAEVDQRQ